MYMCDCMNMCVTVNVCLFAYVHLWFYAFFLTGFYVTLVRAEGFIKCAIYSHWVEYNTVFIISKAEKN